MRKASIWQIGFVAWLVWLCSVRGDAQVLDPRLYRPDPNNASIAGRVLLPSGRSADVNIKVTLSNQQSMLMTLVTSKHGEFQFQNLSEGTYFVQAVDETNIFDGVTETVRLVRGQVTQVNLVLRSKAAAPTTTPKVTTVSAKTLEQQVPPAARKAYAQAVKLLSKGRRAEAIQQLQQALTLYPEYLAARNDLGAQLLKLNQFDEAATQFQRVLAQDPNYTNAHFNLGLVLLEQKRYGEALARLRQALALDQTRPDVQLWLGVALLETNDLAAAERALTKALITGGRELAVSHFYLAQLYLRRADAAAATQALKVYLEEAPKGEQVEEARALLKKLATGHSDKPLE
jgi:TolA-binding protein